MHSVTPSKRPRKPEGATHYDCLKRNYYQTQGIFQSKVLVWAMGQWLESTIVTASMLERNKERFEWVGTKL